ncbi:unnamed protein product [Adineta steineri]|uniref:Uncharacterized protein n=1 Tax=Adineta steineri TaxID=433720 RepID=A0A816FK89_9BILA|nr:unnamed protein product [Adineta steineri]CAF1662699.1 unnamed protein product [Adineta steineri]
MGSSQSTNETDAKNEDTVIHEISNVIAVAAGTHVGATIAGPGGAVIGAKVGDYVLTPVVETVAKSKPASAYETSHGTIFTGAGGSFMYGPNGEVFEL